MEGLIENWLVQHFDIMLAYYHILLVLLCIFAHTKHIKHETFKIQSIPTDWIQIIYKTLFPSFQLNSFFAWKTSKS